MSNVNRTHYLATARVAFFCLSAGALFSACGGKSSPAKSAAGPDAGPAAEAQSPALSQTGKTPPPPAPAEIWKLFSGDRAFADVRKQVEFGPRPSGSPEIELARAHIVASLQEAGWEVEQQEFTDTTPRGPIKFVNVIARFGIGGARPVPTTTQLAIVCSHFDTKRFSTIKFVGASDGASSTGALLELARVLALDHVLASKVELVFFDGEEALVQFTGPEEPKADGLYGSRYYAHKLRETGRAKQFKFGILWDMIGDRNLTITLSPDSPQALMRDLLASADALGKREYFGLLDRSLLDDHVPLYLFARIPTIDIIDFNYDPWHTADDTLDKLSPASLQTIGSVTLFQLKKALAK